MNRLFDTQLSPAGRHALFRETLFLAAYTLFVLFMFQPFGTYEYTHPYKLLQLAGYGLLVGLCYPLLKQLLLRVVVRNVYQLKHEALILALAFLIIIIAGFFYQAWAIMGDIYWQRLPGFMKVGSVFMILPFCALLYHNLLKAKKQAPEKNDIEKNDIEEQLEIKGTNQREHFYFNAADVLYLKANGNYVMIYFQKNGALKHEMIRNTMSQVAEQLSGTDFTPVHRSFMVNVKQFDKLGREEGKPVLVNQQFDIKLPVARQHVAVIEQKLSDHR